LNSKLCPACDGNRLTQAFQKNNEVEIIKMHASGFSRGNRNLFRCDTCELIFCDPMPAFDILEENYAIDSDPEFVSQNSSRILTFKKHLKWLEQEMKLDKQSDQILDIGSAGGAFLEAARQLNISAVGLEINPWLVNWGISNYKINLKVGNIEGILANTNKYKAISLWDVLEHLPNPQASLKIITSKIEKKGYLILSLPNTDSVSFKLMRWSWPMHLDVHLLYFNSISIEKLLEKYNYQLVSKKTNRQTLSFGYILTRVLKQLKMINPNKKVTELLLNGWPSKLKITYSIGQTIFLFQDKK
jgi:2-polyprenyl-3-methyl-5-hydroxy-6-metoxy-1,4-benzoquinol methylase